MTLKVRVLTPDAGRFADLAAALRQAECEVEFSTSDDNAAGADLLLLDPELPPGTLEDAERRHIAVTLRHTRGNKRRAALLLGVARSTLLAKVRRYGLDSVGHGMPEPAEGAVS